MELEIISKLNKDLYWYETHYKEKAPKPYAIDILGHAHTIKLPNI